MKMLTHYHSLKRKYLAEFVYGGVDGTITTFAVISGSLGATLGSPIILILGFANLFADGFSMAVSNYLSRRSQESLDGGFTGSAKEKAPIYTALATFVAFVVIGFIPLFSFVLALFYPPLELYSYQLSIFLTAIAFCLVGVGKGVVAGRNPSVSMLETLAIGGAAAIIAFAVGYFLRGLV